MVYTLGTCSWRKADSSPLVAGADSSGIGMSFSRSAIFVGGFLFWRIFTRGVDNGEETREMLLLFDLHDENFQFVRIPAECALMTTAERMQVVDHLLVIKGSPCVVVFEKLLLTNGHHVNHHQQQRNSPLCCCCCCCCCKIHLYVLKDIVKQVWVKETIDVCTTTFSSLSSSWLSPAKFCCCCLDGTASPPTRILSAFDRVLLYWFDGSCLWLLDPWKNNLKVVKCSHDDRKLFEHKMKGHHIQDVVGNHTDTCNANIYFQDADVQLIADSENFTTLRAFIPKGAKKIGRLDVLRSRYTGYVSAIEASGSIAFAF
ncbi:uncharacterized protein LOC113356793 [Papaver somniferum]|uniref:uncharacterized protein LOC113356793 n=1 Tax=Papaver somniferum TaxID=3469 RepID=UPI000E6FFB0C|nr:uncharacterized protein LOC113356793 [Papaver somniferum]XP_026455799.1 uncharacterized protein LOC113356793 [Papaver somniferum]XP_026455800.1 uncharacterized protein LOC113356793 [Papaver somniferum]